jgi:hypothetical protein
MKQTANKICFQACFSGNSADFRRTTHGVMYGALPIYRCENLKSDIVTTLPEIVHHVSISNWRVDLFPSSGDITGEVLFYWAQDSVYKTQWSVRNIKTLDKTQKLINIVTCFISVRDNNNVDSPDLTRKFIGTIVEITHNRYNTQFHVW